MGIQIVMGVMMLCFFGTAPCSLIVLPVNRVLVANMPAANIMDYLPVVNIPTFAMCTSMANPATASATSAARAGLYTSAITSSTIAAQRSIKIFQDMVVAISLPLVPIRARFSGLTASSSMAAAILSTSTIAKSVVANSGLKVAAIGTLRTAFPPYSAGQP